MAFPVLAPPFAAADVAAFLAAHRVELEEVTRDELVLEPLVESAVNDVVRSGRATLAGSGTRPTLFSLIANDYSYGHGDSGPTTLIRLAAAEMSAGVEGFELYAFGVDEFADPGMVTALGRYLADHPAPRFCVVAEIDLLRAPPPSQNDRSPLDVSRRRAAFAACVRASSPHGRTAWAVSGQNKVDELATLISTELDLGGYLAPSGKAALARFAARRRRLLVARRPLLTRASARVLRALSTPDFYNMLGIRRAMALVDQAFLYGRAAGRDEAEILDADLLAASQTRSGMAWEAGSSFSRSANPLPQPAAVALGLAVCAAGRLPISERSVIDLSVPFSIANALSNSIPFAAPSQVRVVAALCLGARVIGEDTRVAMAGVGLADYKPADDPSIDTPRRPLTTYRMLTGTIIEPDSLYRSPRQHTRAAIRDAGHVEEVLAVAHVHRDGLLALHRALVRRAATGAMTLSVPVAASLVRRHLAMELVVEREVES